MIIQLVNNNIRLIMNLTSNIISQNYQRKSASKFLRQTQLTLLMSRLANNNQTIDRG